MKIGVQLPEVEREVGWPELRRMAELAEGIGLDSVWVGDHLLYRDDGRPARGPWEAWSLLAALAAITERVELGPLVAATSFHNPAMIAKKAATIEEISGGRLILGLGAGWNRPEYDAYGFPFDRRVSRFEESFTVIRELLTTGRSDFAGKFIRLDRGELVPRGPRAAGPPLMVGSLGERMLSITLPHVTAWNAWFSWYGNSVDGYRQLGDPDRPDAPAIPGDPATLVPALQAFAEEGVGHVQLVLDPITESSIAALEPTVAALRG